MSPSEQDPESAADERSATDQDARMATPPAPAPFPSEDLRGRRIAGRFLIEESLGLGPIGHVYRARCDDGNLVALKVLLVRHRDDTNVVRRFARAAAGSRPLQHPNILRTLEHGIDDGIPFICCELGAGQPIDRALAGSPLTLRRVLVPLCDALSALAEAHRQGIIHRCLKPANVLVEPKDDGALLTKLCDFDMGRLLKPVPGTARTKLGASCGAAEYMAPEQALTTEIDGRADVYAVGVMLYELLTGQVPFRGTRPEDILFKHQNEPIVAPRSLRKDRTIPREVESICLRALSKRPADRYQSPREMSSAIRATLELFGARANLPIEEPEAVLDASAHTVSKDRLTMPGEHIRSRQKVGLGAALLVSVCGALWLSAPHETGDQPIAGERAPSAPAIRAALTKARVLLDDGQAAAALEQLESAQSVLGDSPELERLLGEALLRVGQRERGTLLLRRYLTEHPEAADRQTVETLLAGP